MKVAFFPLSHEVSGPCNPDLRYVNVMTSKIFTSSKVPVLAASWTISATHKKRERDTIGNLMIIYRVALITLTRSVVLPVYGVCVWLPVSGMCRVPTYLSIPSIHPSSHHPMPYLIPANVPWESVDIRRRASEREKKKKKNSSREAAHCTEGTGWDGDVLVLQPPLSIPFLGYIGSWIPMSTHTQEYVGRGICSQLVTVQLGPAPKPVSSTYRAVRESNSTCPRALTKWANVYVMSKFLAKTRWLNGAHLCALVLQARQPELAGSIGSEHVEEQVSLGPLMLCNNRRRSVRNGIVGDSVMCVTRLPCQIGEAQKDATWGQS